MGTYVTYSILFLTYLSFLIHYKKFKYNRSTLYFIAFTVLLATEIIANIQFEQFHQKNLLTYLIGVDFIYGLLVIFFYYTLLKKNKIVQWCLLLFSLFNLIMVSYFLISATNYDQLNLLILKHYNIIYFVNLVLFLFVILNYIYETFNSNIILNLKQYFPFWITISLLVYFIGCLPIYISLTSLKEDMEIFQFFNTVIPSISYILLIIGIFLNQPIKYTD